MRQRGTITFKNALLKTGRANWLGDYSEEHLKDKYRYIIIGGKLYLGRKVN